jgi:hypothetical protein
MHEIGRINGRRGFQTGRNVFQIGGNKFYDPKYEIRMKIPMLKMSKIVTIAEFCGIPTRFPNQVAAATKAASACLPDQNDASRQCCSFAAIASKGENSPTEQPSLHQQSCRWTWCFVIRTQHHQPTPPGAETIKTESHHHK